MDLATVANLSNIGEGIGGGVSFFASFSLKSQLGKIRRHQSGTLQLYRSHSRFMPEEVATDYRHEHDYLDGEEKRLLKCKFWDLRAVYDARNVAERCEDLYLNIHRTSDDIIKSRLHWPERVDPGRPVNVVVVPLELSKRLGVDSDAISVISSITDVPSDVSSTTYPNVLPGGLITQSQIDLQAVWSEPNTLILFAENDIPL